jgi:hypothetical protein
LATLLDSDAGLEWTTEMFELLGDTTDTPVLITAVTLTLVWADRVFASQMTAAQRLVAVLATIENNQRLRKRHTS